MEENYRILKILDGKDKGNFLLQRRYDKEWHTIALESSRQKIYESYLFHLKPIVGNRLVSDKTFAIRLRSFLRNIEVNDSSSEEELEYLTRVADRLIQYQKETVLPGTEEEQYLKNCKVL